ncbi:DUF885 domain-containing protein [Christiangramia echinicola]|uniref:Uncharacterized conserved protein, DUF885 familyt n=1 Tax=Christiangramia echinicola TaxID=279359 RepID=A0A1H1QCU9_9FLAO|nr:DUF885 domain-containing protein [Christiangramia echinicola]SDS21107.1 Uncharacterized conserved protein, DUF885 familyt [Christiangramia echinicola]
MKIRNSILSILLAATIFSCGNNQNEDNLSSGDVAQESAELNKYFNKEFQKEVDESPMMQTRMGMKSDYGKWDDFSNLKYAEDLEQAKTRLDYLDKINKDALDEDTRLSYDLFKRQVQNEIDDYKYRFYDYPVEQMHGIHAELPAFLINMHRVDSIADARAYISRLVGVEKVINDIIEQLKLREQNGVVPPKFVFDRTLDASRNIIKGKPFTNSAEASTLMEDFTSKIEKLDISEAQKTALINEAETALVEHVQPAYESLIEFLANQQKRATEEAGVWKFPKGDEFYNNALKRVTTTNLTAEEIHKIGLNEVARIHGEMEKIMEEVGFEGTLVDFFEFMKNDEQFYYENTEEGKATYLKEAKEIINSMKAKLPELFNTKPDAGIIVKAVEPFREKSAGKAFYQQPAIDGSRPGTYYANLYDMKAMPKYEMEALAYHEGIPGHHMQIAIAQELDSIPEFRKYGRYTAYVEGWGLYSEYIPKEIGFYKDPYSDFGRLAMELWRSCRLVVDTGIHAKKWTRQEGIDYYKENTPAAESACVKMVERHIVMPGQATAYKIGMNKIMDLRENAKERLGNKFKIAEFHDVVLTDGALPLTILESRVNSWIKSKKR